MSALAADASAPLTAAPRIPVGTAAVAQKGSSPPPLEENPPPFDFSEYLKDGHGAVLTRADVLLVRRPKHLEHVYALSNDGSSEGYGQAKKLFSNIEGQFKQAGVYVANQVASLRCAAVELPDCVYHL